MKRLLFISILLGALVAIQAQTLPGINYQALLRNANGQPISNQTIGLQASILHGLDSVEVYKETHTAATNAFGQLNLSIGEGEPESGSFGSINWGNGPYLLKTAVDLTGSGTFQDLEVVKFYSVPFAKHAEKSNGIPTMTYEERDAIENPFVGMMILNTSTGNLNYFYNNRWHEPDGSINSFYTCGDKLLDYHDGKQYNTVQIGAQCWMAENLNVGIRIDGIENQTNNGVIEKYCYDNNEANCDIYGGLYQWDEMMQYITQEGTQGICPDGWHIPTDNEWKILEGTVDSQYPVGDPEWDASELRGFDAGINLKAIIGWDDNGNGTDLFGFSGLPGGHRGYSGDFSYLGEWADFWSSTESNIDEAWLRRLTYFDSGVRRFNYHKANGRSVRCVRD